MTEIDLKKKATVMVIIIISIVVLMNIFASLLPEVQSAGNTLNETGVPLGSLFSGQSLIMLLIMISLLITFFTILKPKK